jgi:hypothetical protein
MDSSVASWNGHRDTAPKYEYLAYYQTKIMIAAWCAVPPRGHSRADVVRFKKQRAALAIAATAIGRRDDE